MTKEFICQNHGHFAKKNEVRDRISKSLSQQNLRCPSPYGQPIQFSGLSELLIVHLFLPLKRNIKYQNGMYVSPKIGALINKQLFSFVSLNLLPFLFRQILNPWPSRHMFFSFFSSFFAF